MSTGSCHIFLANLCRVYVLLNANLTKNYENQRQFMATFSKVSKL